MTCVEELLVRLFNIPNVLILESDACPTKEVVQCYGAFQIDSVPNVQAAMRLLHEKKYALILIDLATFDVTDDFWVKFCPSVGNKPVVVLSCSDVSDLEPFVKHLELATFLSRPLAVYDVEKLVRLFKFKVRSREVSDYFKSLDQANAGSTNGVVQGEWNYAVERESLSR